MRHSKKRIAVPRIDSGTRTSVSTGSVLLRCAIILAITVGSILGYWAAAINEQIELPGIKNQIQATSLSSTEPKVVLQTLTDIAKNHNGEIVVEIPTPSGRTIYAGGANSDEWLQEGYQGIPGSPTIEVHPLASLPHLDYRQVLELIGTDSFKDDVIRYLDSQNIQHEELVSQGWIFLLQGTAIGDMTKLLLGFCIALASTGMILNSHAEAVRRLHGYRLLDSILHEIKRASHVSQAALVILVLLCLWGIAIYSNATSALHVLKFQSVFILTSLTTTCIALAGTLILLRAFPISLLLAGKLPGKSALTLAYIVRMGSYLAIATMLIGTINYTSEWNKQNSEANLWNSVPEAYSMSLSGARNMEDLASTSRKLASSLRAKSADDSLAYARFVDAGLIRGSKLDRETMVYNQTAANSSLSGELREAYEAALADNAYPTEPIWLIPDNLPHSVDMELIETSLTAKSSAQKIIFHAGTSKALTWEVGEDQWMNRSEVSDPLVAVFPNDNLPIDDRSLVAAVTQRDIALLNYDDFLNLQGDPQIGSFIRAASPLSQTWSHNHRTMGQTVWIYIGGLSASIILCIVSSIAATYTLFRVFRQRLRTSFIHGVYPIKLMTGIAVIEISLFSGVLYYLWHRGEAVRVWSEGGALAGAVDPSTIAMFNVPQATWLTMPFFIIFTSIPLISIWLGPKIKGDLIYSRK